MDPKNNVFSRLKGIFLSPKETLQDIADAPTSWKYIFLLPIIFLAVFCVFFIQVPSGLNSILIIASTLPMYLIILLFIVVVAIVSLLYDFLLFIIFFIGRRLRKSKNDHRSQKAIFNLYIYSLSPLLLLITQIPFILIFGGHYSLFNLRFYFFFLFGMVIGWHVVLLYRAIQTNSDISPNRAKLLTGIYIGSIAVLALVLVYATYYINFDISWLGALPL